MKAFISYSHSDETYLKKLQVALAQMRRQGILQEWTDNEIEAGDRLNQKINTELNSSQLFLALVSPDYIASNYCYEKEFQQAQQLEKEEEMKIIPIICRPCDWKNTPFTEFKALPKDGKPISDWQNEDSALFNITEMLRSHIQQPIHSTNLVTKQEKGARKFEGNYKVRKEFDIVQRSNFVDKSFEEVKGLLKEYLEELATSENVTYKILTDTNKNLKCYLVNRDMGIAQCECLLKKMEERNNPSHFNYNEGDLSAVFKKENREESMSFTLSNDEYEMFFSARNMMLSSRNDEKRHDSKSMANEIWRKWLTQIGIDIFKFTNNDKHPLQFMSR